MNAMTEWLAQFFDEVEPEEFYRGIFPKGELDQRDSYTKGKYTAIAIEVTKKKNKSGKPKINRYTVTDDLDTIAELCANDNFCLMSPISYAGKHRSAESARNLYAIAVDLDRVRIKDGKPVGLIDLWNGHIMRVERIPKPTYIVSSGTGLHLYYVMEKPIPLFANVAKQLQKLKHELTELIWNEGIVDIKDDREIQQEGIYQGFRVPGTITKDGARARAFETGEKVTLEYLNEFVSEKNRVIDFAVKSDCTLAEAKEKYPDWYERRIENGEKRGTWHVSRRLYDWWKERIRHEARVGHRYYCLMTLSIYAQKCSMYDEKHNPNPVTRAELEADCFELMEIFEALTGADETNHFDESDVMDALEAFDNRWITYPRNSVEYKSGIKIEPQNRRNGRTQKAHLKRARAVQAIDYPDGEWRDGNGRKSKQELIEQWQREHSNGTIEECIQYGQIKDDKGKIKFGKSTVYKYWSK